MNHLLTVDTHCHVHLDWFEPVEVLIFQMDRNDVDKAVLVQIRGELDNSYLLECVRRFPGRFAVIGAIDGSRPDAVAELDRSVSAGIQGIRMHLDASGVPALPRKVLERAAQLKLKVSCVGPYEGFASDAFRDLIAQLQELSVIIEHLGFVGDSAREDDPAFARILGLAEYRNVYMKVPGLGELMRRPLPMTHPPFDLERVPPFIEMAMRAFGPDRLMIGSDSPPSSYREGYANVFRYLRKYLAARDPADQAAILGRTALSLFAF